MALTWKQTTYLAAAVGLIAAVAACASAPTYRYRPYSVRENPDRIVLHAVIFYEGDMAILRDAGATYIGTLDVKSAHDPDAPEARYRAAIEAANAGGTHIIQTSAGAAKQVTTWTASAGGSSSAERSRPRAATPTRGAAYYVVRVDEPALKRLPRALKPLGIPGASCEVAEVHEVLMDTVRCFQRHDVESVRFVIAPDGQVTKLLGLEGEAERCFAHALGPADLPSPGREVTCSIALP